jgi:hypothetical protein
MYVNTYIKKIQQVKNHREENEERKKKILEKGRASKYDSVFSNYRKSMVEKTMP